MDWLNAVVQGVLLGGLYALLATGLSLVFGVMRLVNLAQGDLDDPRRVPGPRARRGDRGRSRREPLIVVVPLMMVGGYVLQRGLLNRTLEGGVLPPLLVTFGLAVDPPERAADGVYTADSQGLDAGAIESASIRVTDRLAVGLAAAAHARRRRSRCSSGLQLLLGRTALGRALRATVGRRATRPAWSGIDDRHVYAVAMAIALGTVAIGGVFLGIRTTFAPARRAGPAHLRVRGGRHRRARVAVGDARRRRSSWASRRPSATRSIPRYQILAGHLVFLAVLVFRPRACSPRPRSRGSDATTTAAAAALPGRARTTRSTPAGRSPALGAGRGARPACRPGATSGTDAAPGRVLHAARDGPDVEPPRRLRRSRLDRPAGVHRHRAPTASSSPPTTLGLPPVLGGRCRDRGDRRARGARHVASSRSGCRAATSRSGRGSSPRSSGSSSPTPRSSGRAPGVTIQSLVGDAPGRPPGADLLAGARRRGRLDRRSRRSIMRSRLGPRAARGPRQRGGRARASASTSSATKLLVYIVAAVGCAVGRGRALHAAAPDPAERRVRRRLDRQDDLHRRHRRPRPDRGPDRRVRSCSSRCRRRSPTTAALYLVDPRRRRDRRSSLLAPRGLWGLVVARRPIALFGIQRRLVLAGSSRAGASRGEGAE